MKAIRRLRRVLLGAPVPSNKSEHTLLSKLVALPVFASDAISSVAYASQQILLALGAAGLWLTTERARYDQYAFGIAVVIVLLLVVVVTSYWQTVFAYPAGGGSYIVSKENLGTTAGLIAAAALLIDYVLTVSVSVAAGLQNLAGIPFLRNTGFDGHLVSISLVTIGVLTVANLRGLKESGSIFSVFTYGFVTLCLLMILIGLFGPLFGWTFDTAEVEQVYRDYPGGPNSAAQALRGFSLVVLLRAFANGCSAMTGTEAVSNGIPSFAEPKCRNAAITLLWMAGILGVLFLGITAVALKLHIVYWEAGGRTAPSVIDQISGAIFGKHGPLSILYLTTQISTAAVLILAANTSFADFPRLSSILARDGFVPRQLSSLGDKLVFHNGIIVLGILAGTLVAAKGGNVDSLIPMYAVGVFLAFTLSQYGMVIHWKRHRGEGWVRRAAINGCGALLTAIVLVDIIAEKFFEGAWFVVIVLAILVAIFRSISVHYEHVRQELAPPAAIPEFIPRDHVVVIPVSGFHRGVLPALEYARGLSSDCRAVYVEIDPQKTTELTERWKSALPEIPLVVLKSPFRSLLRPLLKYLDTLEREDTQRNITVIIPEFVTPTWWQRCLHGNTALLIKLALANRRHIVICNVRYHLPLRRAAEHRTRTCSAAAGTHLQELLVKP